MQLTSDAYCLEIRQGPNRAKVPSPREKGITTLRISHTPPD